MSQTARLLNFARRLPEKLDENPAHVFAADHALSLYAKDAVYSFIPKNGCSTLRFSLAVANGCIQGPEDIDWIHRNNRSFIATQRDLILARYSFVVLRCPFARLASVFLDKVASVGIPMNPLYDLHLEKLSPSARTRAKALRRIKRSVMGKPMDPGTFSFREFVSLLEQPGGLQVNHHWTPQVQFMVYDRYDDVFQLEDFRTCVSTLYEKIGFEVQDARRLTGHGTDALDLDDSQSYADTPIRTLHKMRKDGRAPAHKALFDDDLRARVTRLYKDDISLYTRHFGAEKLTFPEVAIS